MGDSIIKFVIWICKKFNIDEVKAINIKLTEILKDPNSEFYPKNSFQEEHPNYRKFAVDPLRPLKKKLKKRK